MKPRNSSMLMMWVLCVTAIVALVDIDCTFAAEKKKGTGKNAPPISDLYTSEPAQLTPVQCGQCHSGLYNNLKNDGGRHRFECQKCHKSFHAYSPVKNNWQELMPKCRDCHLLPHGEKITDCSSCHSNPHAATKIPMSKLLLSSCTSCHGSPFEQLQKFPSKHSKLSCDNCHTSHGFVPSCNACHKPHFEGQEFSTCASECHPVHQPLQIQFAKDANAKTCNACHGKVYLKWSKTPSKHAKVNCVSCHSKHGYIPQCNVCHTGPHSKQLHERFPKCLTCHQDPHDLPVKQRGN